MTAEDSLKILLFGLLRRSRAEAEKQFARAKIQITPFQYGILHMIRKDGKCLNDLAKILGIRPPSLVPALDSLEKQGFVERIRDCKDRRKIHLRITRSGLQVMKKILSGHPTDALNKAFNKLAPAGQKQLLSLLFELTNNFNK